MRRVLIVLLAAIALLVPVAPAHAAARVTVTGDGGTATVDPTYLTTLTVTGRGFQSVAGGHGGIYVFFGTVSGTWRPSQGGQTGRDLLYVPDDESADNAGHQRFIAFPGSDTAGSATSTMRADGSWSTTINVPGAAFDTVDRDGAVRRVDCRRVTCGVITVGAHGVVNARNESFTPVRVASVAPTEPAASTPASTTTDGDDVSTAAPTAEPADEPTDEPAGTKRPRPGKAVPATLEVDRASARPGNVLAFTAAGLTPGSQVSAVLDDGAAGAGPFLVGPDGRLAGVVSIPASTEVGTHELRLFGVEEPPSVSFAVTDVSTPDTAPTPVTTPVAAEVPDERGAVLFAAGSAAVLLLALARLVVVRRRTRRA
ncbi:hypothetical protein [Nocardioides flavescens]|uniref:Uncharacterized protein n=1 Tax=Nocardioides flavescens TaxID=2691959 RepID=A0A6L7EXQ0_9ACTN|nr:hypothetical protein [Nocardioides flavescens]MXG88172.1 hypothetical protein [Nocardioides flavescens]